MGRSLSGGQSVVGKKCQELCFGCPKFVLGYD